MSSIAALFNVPSTPEELGIWATAHATHHRDINRRIFELTGTNLPEFILDPLNPNNTGVWEDQHQAAHQDMDTILGINGFDLSDLNFKDPQLLAAWVQLNANEHYTASNLLGIG